MNDSTNTSMVDEDFDLARDNIRDVIEKGKDAMDYALQLISESEHPRAVEVFAGLLRAQTQANAQLMDIHKTNKEIKTKNKHTDILPHLENEKSNTTNIVFTGTTSDLQNFITNTMKDITPEDG